MRHVTRGGGRLSCLVASALLLAGSTMVTTAAPAAATDAGTHPVHQTLHRQVQMAEAECANVGSSIGRQRTPAARSCSMSITLELSAEPMPPIEDVPGATALANTCTTTWIITSLRATVQSIFWGILWSATANATGYGDSCGRVKWTSVTCDQHGIGYAVRIDWCGAYPGTLAWYPYTTTNMGLNITVSAVANGTPISYSHGARNGFNPYTGTQYGFFVW